MASLRTLEGPVELIDGALSLRIPRALAEAGNVALLGETNQGDDTSLTVRIPDSVAASLELTAGSMASTTAPARLRSPARTTQSPMNGTSLRNGTRQSSLLAGGHYSQNSTSEIPPPVRRSASK